MTLAIERMRIWLHEFKHDVLLSENSLLPEAMIIDH